MRGSGPRVISTADELDDDASPITGVGAGVAPGAAGAAAAALRAAPLRVAGIVDD